MTWKTRILLTIDDKPVRRGDVIVLDFDTGQVTVRRRSRLWRLSRRFRVVKP